MKYNLLSVPMFHTPGVAKWLVNVAKTDPKTARNIAREGFEELPEEGIEKLLAGDFTVEGETVVVEVGS